MKNSIHILVANAMFYSAFMICAMGEENSYFHKIIAMTDKQFVTEVIGIDAPLLHEVPEIIRYREIIRRKNSIWPFLAEAKIPSDARMNYLFAVNAEQAVKYAINYVEDISTNKSNLENRWTQIYTESILKNIPFSYMKLSTDQALLLESLFPEAIAQSKGLDECYSQLLRFVENKSNLAYAVRVDSIKNTTRWLREKQAIKIVRELLSQKYYWGCAGGTSQSLYFSDDLLPLGIFLDMGRYDAPCALRLEFAYDDCSEAFYISAKNVFLNTPWIQYRVNRDSALWAEAQNILSVDLSVAAKEIIDRYPAMREYHMIIDTYDHVVAGDALNEKASGVSR
jgi:hypothetical protein